MKHTALLAAILTLAAPSVARANRDPVLKQIDLPHSYYYREMYLPQLTSGPGSVAFADDSTVVYSMQGNLWRQRLGTTTAEQLTQGAGYDYQPDVSRDGKYIAYASYQKDAVELYLLDTATGQSTPITQNGAVNLEPRWSPDGTRLAFVSTLHSKRFHVFVATFAGGKVEKIERYTGETKSTVPRYYYSEFDHELSPTWSPDGRELIFVTNRGLIYGTGGFYRAKAAPNAPAKPIHEEETTWKARPDWSPDGRRVAYASYLGGQWHHLWLVAAEGGHPIELTYGDHDDTQPRWSPDGKKIAFISNRTGNTSLWVIELPGGRQERVVPQDRRWLRDMGQLRIIVAGPSTSSSPARISVTDAGGRSYAPDDAWIYADDGFDRAERPFEAHYFHNTTGICELTVPPGIVDVEVMRGFEHQVVRTTASITPQRTKARPVKLHSIALPAEPGVRWVSGDLHVHMNYGGTYRNTPKNLAAQALAENLNIVENLIVNKEQRIPDIAYYSTARDPVSTTETAIFHDQEFHTSWWGHLGLIGLRDHFLLPDYAAYPGTPLFSLAPINSTIADLAHAQGALVGYVHPYDELPDPQKDARLTHALPVDVALGKVDYLEVVGFSDHLSTATVWYRLLNLGFHLPAGAGTDAMANYASLRGPVGMNRVYVRMRDSKPVPIDIDAWRAALKRGETFATNGPLLAFTLGGRSIGGELALPEKSAAVPFTASVRSIVPLDSAAIVCNGAVVRELALSPSGAADAKGTIPLETSGWCVLRASSKTARHPVLDIYPYATTSPIYVTVAGKKPWSADDAKYFAAWIARLREAAAASDAWNTAAEKSEVLSLVDRAAARFAAPGPEGK